jgi:ABC-2 type transport system permease protein
MPRIGPMRRVWSQARMEIVLTLRRGESLLVTIGIPVGILAFFSIADVLPHDGRAVDFLMPGVLGLSVISSAMTSLSIATGFERQSGVLRRLGITPLGRTGLLAAKLIALLFVVVLQVAAVVAVGVALGWRANASPAAVLALLLGTVAFAAIGFVLAGRLRAETNLAAANGLFLLFLLAGGIVFPLSRLPEAIRTFARVLPTEPFIESLRAALVHGVVDTERLVALAIWAAVLAVLARAAFRWE